MAPANRVRDDAEPTSDATSACVALAEEVAADAARYRKITIALPLLAAVATAVLITASPGTALARAGVAGALTHAATDIALLVAVHAAAGLVLAAAAVAAGTREIAAAEKDGQASLDRFVYTATDPKTGKERLALRDAPTGREASTAAALMYTLSLATGGAQVYLAAKTVSFEFANEAPWFTAQAVSLLVVACAVMATHESAKLYASAATKHTWMAALTKQRARVLVETGGAEDGVMHTDSGVRVVQRIQYDAYLRMCAKIAWRWRASLAVGTLFLTAANVADVWVAGIKASLFDAADKRDFDGAYANVRRLLVVIPAYKLSNAISIAAWELMGNALGLESRTSTIASIARQDLAYFDQLDSASIVNMVNEGTFGMCQAFRTELSGLVSHIATLAGGAYVLANVSWRFLIFLVIVKLRFAPIHDFASWIAHVDAERKGEARGVHEALGRHIMAATRHVRLVQTALMESWVSSRAAKLIARWEALSAVKLFVPERLYGMTMASLGACLTLVATFALSSRDVTVGHLYLMVMVGPLIVDSLQGIASWHETHLMHARGIGQMAAFLQSLPDTATGNAPLPEGKTGPNGGVGLSVVFDHVSFAYQLRPDTRVLDKVSLDVPAGSSCGLVGGSGAGKSTVLALAMRFYLPTEGEIRIHSASLASLDLTAYKRRVAFVPQEPIIFDEESVFFNITYGVTPRPDPKAVWAALEKAALDEFARQRFGEKLTTHSVSGGEKQRIAIARMLLREPSIILADEMTSALDAVTENFVMSSIKQATDATRILVAHRLQAVAWCDALAVFANGRVAETGTHAQLLAKGGEYATMVKLHSTASNGS